MIVLRPIHRLMETFSGRLAAKAEALAIAAAENRLRTRRRDAGRWRRAALLWPLFAKDD